MYHRSPLRPRNQDRLGVAPRSGRLPSSVGQRSTIPLLAWDQTVDAHAERHQASPENRVVDDLWASHYNVIHSGASE
jgi:hypothetical protein